MLAGLLSAGCTALAYSSAPSDPALIAQGEAAFQSCTGCHAVANGAPSGAGPNLYGVAGRSAGVHPDYAFSGALASSGIVWDAASLDAFLADPSGTVPGSEMEAGMVRDAAERRAIVAYLMALGS